MNIEKFKQLTHHNREKNLRLEQNGAKPPISEVFTHVQVSWVKQQGAFSTRLYEVVKETDAYYIVLDAFGRPVSRAKQWCRGVAA